MYDLREELNKERFSDLVLEALVTLENTENFKELETIPDLFKVLKIPVHERSELLIAEILKEVVNYSNPEETKGELTKLNNDVMSLYVEIACKNLYCRYNDLSRIRKLHKMAFLKLRKYSEERRQTIFLPYHGERLYSEKDINREDNIVLLWKLREYKDIEQIKDNLIFQGSMERFIFGNYVYRIHEGSLICSGTLAEAIKRRHTK